jgi:dipeptidyl aminopeptidase/acylaminoacyl peptidase
MRRSALLVTLSLFIAIPVSAQQRGLEPEDFYKEIGVGGVALSPDGSMVAFTVTTIVEEENRRHTEIWLQRLANGQADGEPFRFTSPTEESSNPSWSPDSRLLSFSSRRGDDDNSTWFVRISAAGGEAHHIEGVDATPIWSPDGRWIAFTRAPDDDSDDEDEGQREGWISPNAISKTLSAERFDGRVITSMRYKRDGALQFLPDPSIRDKRQLFVVPAGGGEPVQLTEMPFDVGSIEWSPDGQTILFTGDERQDDELNTEPTVDIYAVARSGGQTRRLTENPGSESNPEFSPDGRRLTYSYTAERGSLTELRMVDVSADGTFQGSSSNVMPTWNDRFGGVHWTPDGSALRFGAGIGGNAHIFEVSASGGEPVQLSEGDRQLSGFSTSADGVVTAFTATDAMHPAELYVHANGNEQRLTSFNDAWLAEIDLQPAERMAWAVADGTEIEGWLVKPVGYTPGRSYPLVLKIHGGPHGAYGNTWFRTFHVLSADGMFVLYPNPRGSSNYGHEFMYATRGKWGEMDQEDFLTGVEAAIAAYPDIDTDRIGVSGGSYGGFFTNWLTATTDRFAAAVTSRSITNWESWYGYSDAQGLTEYEFFGTPWEQRELYRRLSPISYVENVTAPTLIIHSENDYRTPIGDGEQWFMALKKRGVPVELVRYPRSSHGLSRGGEPWLLVDRLERLSSWFSHWLIDVPEGQVTTSQP